MLSKVSRIFQKVTEVVRQLTLEAEVREQGDVLGPFLALCQLGENEKPFVALALAESNTLQTRCQAVQVTFSHTASPHHPVCTNMFIAEIDDGKNDAYREYPLCDVERNQLGELNVGRPLVKQEQIHSREGIYGIDRHRYEE